MIVKYIRISGDPLSDECFRFPRLPGYEATKSHSQRDPERPRNPKRLERERYDLPRIISYQFGLRCCAGSWPRAKARNGTLEILGFKIPGLRRVFRSQEFDSGSESRLFRISDVSVERGRSFPKRYERIFT